MLQPPTFLCLPYSNKNLHTVAGKEVSISFDHIISLGTCPYMFLRTFNDCISPDSITHPADSFEKPIVVIFVPPLESFLPQPSLCHEVTSHIPCSALCPSSRKQHSSGGYFQEIPL